ncbi:MAG: hypothetical protein Tp182DCM212571_49 [Prokaryotic dsDNA virus sp.]|jgi:hypothetical protein|nr:MAG: hypothetical protein Tp182DCM212571_49 [Prokaryotic dsDNA virus sp.]|tara:strand:+ start:26034 stop:26459 length:426 start_codon:yes stop_codon:yes gene_type:complete
MPNLETVQEAIIALLESEMAQDCYEQAIPDSKTVIRNSAGQVVPYVAYQFGDIIQVGATSLVGPRYHNYILPFSTQSVAASASIARRISNKITDVLLGYSSAHTGSIYKRPGGRLWPIVSSTGATEAYQMPSDFGIPIQFE